MQVKVSGRSLNVGDALRQQIETTLTGLAEKYQPQSVEAHATIGRENHLFRVDCWLLVGHGIHLQSHGEADNAQAAFALAAQKLEKQLRRHKRRLKDRHLAGRLVRKQEDALMAQAYVLAPEPEAGEAAADDVTGNPQDAHPVIVAETRTEIPTVTVGDAVMLMDLADQPALMFRNRGTGQFNVVYRRPDGNVGWIDPAESKLPKAAQ